MSKTNEYKHFFKPAEPDLKFESRFKSELVNDCDRLEEILSENSGRKYIGVDTETKTLDFDEEDPVCGFSFSFDSISGVYVPIRHKRGKNCDLKSLKILWEFCKDKLVLMYNAPFDMMMFESEGFPFGDFNVRDVMALTYNSDTNIKNNGLKDMSEHFLGRKSPTYDEVIGWKKGTRGKKPTFDMLDPRQGVFYACCDSANTVGLHNLLLPHLKKECRSILKIDTTLARKLPVYLSQKIAIDTEQMKLVMSEIDERVILIDKEIHKKAGYMVNLNSSKQLEKLFVEKGWDTGARTATGAMSFGKEALEECENPVAKKIMERSSLQTQKNTYAKKLTDQNWGRFNYGIFSMTTGRFNSSNQKSPYFLKLNAQNITKPKPAIWMAEEVGSDEPDDKTKFLGYRFHPAYAVDNDEEKKEFVLGDGSQADPNRLVEGFDQSLNIRNAITVPDVKEWTFVSNDYSQLELFLAANLSKDPVMLKAYKSLEDLHRRVAIEMFGERNYDGGKRKFAKGANFSLLYMGSWKALQRSTGLSDSNAQEMWDKYWDTMRVLYRWRRKEIAKARQSGVCYTPYGRPRRLLYYWNHEKNSMQNFGERTVISHIIQGCGGDIMRIVLCKLTKLLQELGQDVLRFVATVHDELNLAIRTKYLSEVYPKVKEIMELTVPGCEMPLRVSAEIGKSYGCVFPFNFDNGIWKPEFLH